ncbi:MAG: MoaD/ThiS family protein [Acidobacteriota bacterium]|nr:MoaD/ThiS family protein [Acidobacteriota bacterium]
MPTVILPASLLERTGGEREISVAGTTAGEVLEALEAGQPTLRGWLLDEQGRLRQHVNVFVDNRRVKLNHPVSENQEVFVIQAITGGSDREAEILVGTKKGLFVLRGPRSGPMAVASRQFAGQVVEYAMRDPRSGRYVVSATHGQFGPHLHLTDDVLGEWQQAGGPAFAPESETSVERIWVVEASAEDSVLWAGVAPAALFKSEDGGTTWHLNESLWNDPSRPQWEGGLGGLTLHSICPWPGHPERLTVAMSAVGVWQTLDGGATWARYSEGLVPRYLPPESHAETLMHCVHKLEQSPTQPETFYLQFHGGVYRSDDAARTWQEISRVGSDHGLPADFGFPIVVDPHDPDRAFVIPLVADVDRVTPEGKVRVYETRDRGATWESLTQGLPQENAYLTVLRQGFCHDGRDPLGLYFGTESGAIFGSADGGATWSTVVENLPPITSVRVSA